MELSVENFLIRKVLLLKTVEFANSEDSDEVAHNEPPRLNLHCLFSGSEMFKILQN